MKELSNYIYERNMSNLLDREFLENVFEEKGSISGHVQFAKFLAGKLVDSSRKGVHKIAFSYDDLKNTPTSLHTLFFNVIVISLVLNKKIEKIYSEYKIDKDDADYAKLERNYLHRLNMVEITIYSPKVYEDPIEYEELIDHELLHAYDEAMSRKNGSNTLYKAILTSGYQTLVTYKEKDTPIDKMVKTVIYLLSDIERNAYISQFKTIVDDEFNIDDNDTVAKLMNSGLYKTYKLVKNNIRFLEQDKESTFSKEFCKSYRKVSSERIEDIKKRNVDYTGLIKDINPNLSDNKIIKKLADRWIKFEHKLYQHTRIKIDEQHVSRVNNMYEFSI